MAGSILRRTGVSAMAMMLLAGGVTLFGQRGARTSVSRGSFSRSSASVNRNFSSTNVNRSFSNTNVNRNVNNVNVNRNVNNVNVNRDVDFDADRRYGWGDGCCYHPAATAAAVTAAAVTTAAVVGSVVHSIPPSCSAVSVNGVTFQQCGSTWYQPQFAGSSVTYVVVNPPR